MRENAPWLYRCRLDCEWQCEHFLEGCFFDCLKWWHPYVQEETYFQERYGFNENRLEVGLRRRLKKDKGFISLGYLLKEVREKTGLWEPTDVLRIRLEWAF